MKSNQLAAFLEQQKVEQEEKLQPKNQLLSLRVKLTILAHLKCNNEIVDDDLQDDLRFFCDEMKDQIDSIQERIKC